MEGVQQNTKKVFVSGVLLLSLSTVLVKLIGLLYKIPMLSYLGSEGMGYFHSAFEIYALFCIIATAGLPVALSVLISSAIAQNREWEVKHIYRSATLIFLIFGAFGSSLMLIFAKAFCVWIKSENAYPCMLSIAPALFFVCISSAIRGYFQGYQKMLPTALSQLIEALGKLGFGLLFAKMALERGYDTAFVAAGAGWGVTLGTVLSTLYLWIEKVRFHPFSSSKSVSSKIKSRSIWKEIGRLAIPMTLGASLGSLTKLIDMTMILRRLQSIGYTEVLANEAYGSYTTLAISVFGLFPALLNSIALPLVPMLSSAIASGNKEKQLQMVETSYRLTSFFAIPAAFGISAFARPILLLLFGKSSEEVAFAAPLLAVLGISVFLSSMISATNSVLHAYQIVHRPIFSMLAGVGVKLVVAYFLIGNPNIGIFGAPISSFFCNLVVVLLNYFFSTKACGKLSVSHIFLRPSIAAGGAVWLALGVYFLCVNRMGESNWLTLWIVSLVVLLYGLFSVLGGNITIKDVEMLPFGERICHVLSDVRKHGSKKRKDTVEK